MRDRWIFRIGVIAGAAVLAACQAHLMTKSLRQSLSDDDAKNVQYFLSDKVMLVREVAADDKTVTPGHEIRILKGKRIEQVIFPKRCLGVEVGMLGDDSLLISFEEGSPESPNPALPFINHGKGIYGLQSGQTVKYLGKDFQVHVGGSAIDRFQEGGLVRMLMPKSSSAVATLIVDLKMARERKKVKRVVPGRRASKN